MFPLPKTKTIEGFWGGDRILKNFDSGISIPTQTLISNP
jgi:hypothetical protein